MINDIPLGRLGQPEDIAQNCFILGPVLKVDGSMVRLLKQMRT